MTVRHVNCKKLNKSLPGLDAPPYPGELGERVYAHISAEAWDMWLGHQTMLINEYRLSLIDQSARTFLMDEMEKFLFNENATQPPGYTPPNQETK